MQPRRLVPPLLSLLGLVACTERESPTAPGEAAEPAFSHVAGHKVVNSLADPGDGTCNAAQCTLREAIGAPGATTISFAPGLTGTITLASPAAGGGPLGVATTLTIKGPAGGVTIRRRSTDPAFRILRVGEGARVTLTSLTLRNGKTDLPGGGIINHGTLTLVKCTVAGNSSTERGGGIANQGPLTLTQSTVSDNSAPSGGGIDNHDVRLVATGGAIARNSGGGIDNRGGTLELTNTTLSDNGGRAITGDWSTFTLNRVRITGNSGGGISLHQSSLTLTNSTIARNSAPGGAGILNSAGGIITITKSTLSNNTASGNGGAILNTSGDPFGRIGATITLVNSTVTGNSAESGGGIHNSDRLGGASIRITNSTVASNSARQGGGGIAQAEGLEDSNPVFLANSLVARNTAPAGPDLLGGFGARFSLIGDGAGSGLTNTNGNQVGNVSPNSSPIDPRLGPAADNGGPTRTHGLLPGSPAINAASTPDCPATDQRGVLRPQGVACDIGSYERE